MGSTPAFADQRRIEASNGSAYATRHTSRGTSENGCDSEIAEKNLSDRNDGGTVVARCGGRLGSLEQKSRLTRGGVSGSQFKFG